jgi:Mrp family chromosome partitioning ATPase
MSRLHDAIEKARKEGTVAKPRPAEPLHPLLNIGGITFVESAPVTPQIEGCLVDLMKEDEPWLEQMRTLATRLRSMEGSERVRRIGLMSAVGGEGKTTLAVMLSLVLAEQPEESVLLVDCDLRHREVEAVLGLRSAAGLSDWIRQPTPEVPLRRIGRKGPFFLSAGRPFSRPWELVSSPQVGTLLDAAGSKFRYVIVDLPAEGPVADAAKIQEHLDGLLLVVRARTAPRDAILSTIEHLQEEKVLGVLFNGENQAAGRLKHYRYSHYSKSYTGKKDRKQRP